MTLIRPHSQTIDSKATRDSSIKKENSGVSLNKQQSSDKNIYKIKDKDIKDLNINKKAKSENNNKEEKKGKISNEINNDIIIEQKKELELTYEELIKKIIYDNFLDNNFLLIYHFCQQCFSFLKIEDIFNQPLNYIDIISKENSLDEKKFNNILEFSKVLIIEMIYYYINTKINKESFIGAKNLCYKLISYIILNTKNNIINETKKIKKEELINDDLNININDIKIFVLKKDKENLNIENNDNNNIKKSNLSKIKHSKTSDKKVTFEGNNMIKEIQEDQLFKISKTLRRSTKNFSFGKDRIKNIIKEEDEKYEKSDDEKHKRKKSSDNSDSDNNSNIELDLFSDDNNSDKKEEKEKEKEKTNNNHTSKDILNNIIKEAKINENIIKVNEEEIYILGNIMNLLEKYQEKDINFDDDEENKDLMKYLKNNINFYKKLQKKINEEKKVLITPRQRQKRYTKNYSSFIFTQKKPEKIEIIREYLSKGYFCVIDWKTEEIGDKLMSVSKNLISKIHPRELYKAIFLKKNKEITSPNVIECINKFNRLTSFIMEDILSYNSPKDRAKVYDKWLTIADYCKNNKDYNDLIAIFSAFNHYIITGLKLTLKELKTRTNSLLNKIRSFCTVEGNYKKIREDMDICDKNGEIFIPYLGMLLRDINFFEEKSKYINEKNHINFTKIEKINEMFKLYFKFKIKEDNKKYNNNNDDNIPELIFFNDLENITEEYLENVANRLEPELKMDTSEKKRKTNTDDKYFSKYIINEKEKEQEKNKKDKENDEYIGSSINDGDLDEGEAPAELDQATIIE